MGLGLTPTGDRVVVTANEEQEKTTASGIVIPDTAKEKPQQGTVKAVGPGRINEQTGQRMAPEVQVGDQVVYAKYAGSEVKIGDTEYLILSEKDVLAIVNKNGSS